MPTWRGAVKDRIIILLLIRFRAGRASRAKHISIAPSLQEVIDEYPAPRRCLPGGLKQQIKRCRRRLVVEKNALQAASGDIGLNLPERHPHYSGAVFCCRYKGVQAIHPEPARYANSTFWFRALLEAPLGGPGCLREHQTIVTAEIARHLRYATAFQISARSADD